MDAYAIIQSGGKQYRVQEGDIIDVELLSDREKEQVDFSDILFFYDGASAQVGQPKLENCAVQGTLLKESKGPKVIAYKYKRRKNYHKKIGHRQKYSRVKITKVGSN